jgi:predicted Zn-dependent protease with MMP-like domain
VSALEAAGIGASRAPTAEEIAAVGEAILRDLPQPYAGLVRHLPVRVEEWPDDATLDDVGIDDPLELTGLYRGVPIGERETLAVPPSEPEMILLYRLPILFEWGERGCALREVVFDVLTHEIGHHLGMDEAQALRMEGRDDEAP